MSERDPYARRVWRGHTFDNRTISALVWVERHYRDVAPKKRAPLRIGQGSYNRGGVAGSAGSHDLGGAVDIMFGGLNPKQRRAVVRWMRKAGFAAWAREGPAWGTNNDHCHGILRGHRILSPLAKDQTVAYDNGRDGLAGNRPDHTWKPRRSRRWSHKQGRPVAGK